MSLLFPDASFYPPGFRYQPNFISPEDEMYLLELISHINLQPFLYQGFTAKRKVASFGLDYSFTDGSLRKGQPIPSEFTFLIRKAAELTQIKPEAFTELLITGYPQGAVINWHRDAPPFDVIVGFSLLADCLFKLRPADKEKQNRRSICALPLERRSVYVLAGEARSAWQHSIAPVTKTRYSITLRTIRS